MQTAAANMNDSPISPIEDILEDARNGKPYILVDAEDRENEGDIIIPAQFATPDQINFMARHARGLICLAITSDRARQLRLPPMAAGLFGVFAIREPGLLWLPMIGVGFAWASIVSMPYAILSAAVPARKMGVYMGVFNIFIVVPQLLAATVLGLILKTLFDGQAIWALVLGAVSFVLAAASALMVKEHRG